MSEHDSNPDQDHELNQAALQYHAEPVPGKTV